MPSASRTGSRRRSRRKVDWRSALLHRLKAPVTPAALNVLDLWEQSEGGLPDNNPFFTTLDMPGGTSINSAGAKRYATLAEGVEATARTLEMSAYKAIVSGLRKRAGAVTLYEAINKSPWCAGCQEGHYPVALYDNLTSAAAGKVLKGASATVTQTTQAVKHLKPPDHGRDPKDHSPKTRDTGRKLSIGGNHLRDHANYMRSIAQRGAPVKRGRQPVIKYNNPNRKRRTPAKMVHPPRLPKWKQVKL